MGIHFIEHGRKPLQLLVRHFFDGAQRMILRDAIIQVNHRQHHLLALVSSSPPCRLT